MKFKAKINKAFNPIKIELVIESKEELCDLWHRMNLSAVTVRKNTSREALPFEASNDIFLWNELDKLVRELKLKSY